MMDSDSGMSVKQVFLIVAMVVAIAVAMFVFFFLGDGSGKTFAEIMGILNIFS